MISFEISRNKTLIDLGGTEKRSDIDDDLVNEIFSKL